MKLRSQWAADGSRWVDNPVVTVRGRWDRYRRILELKPRSHRWGSVARIISVLLALAWVALTVFLWYEGEPVFDVWTWVLLISSLSIALYDRRFGTGPSFEPEAPVRIGFTGTALLWQSQDGRVSGRPWDTVESMGIGRDRQLSAFVVLRGASAVYLRSLNLDLAVRIRWAYHLARTSSLRPQDLGREFAPLQTGGGIPEGGVTLTEASPPLVLYPDRVVLMKRPMHLAFSRADVDGVRFPILGKERLIITIQDHQASFIMDPTRMGRFLEWLGKGDLVEPGPPERPAAGF